MGSGSCIAKDAGAIILLDDNFKTIIDAMKGVARLSQRPANAVLLIINQHL
ncbi:hypothetical protein KOY48_02340 [Candidatus Minimicrobia naudis]|uniref:Uncharacterized protein n=1 Tax=Candidatus Minimicrobia naudis TaxID=2841263 RepID=A0A8F1MC35_9BACT|nr:hypothetical protein KOY48_02340 [Candidatus Minimicrobia naudis]